MQEGLFGMKKALLINAARLIGKMALAKSSDSLQNGSIETKDDAADTKQEGDEA